MEGNPAQRTRNKYAIKPEADSTILHLRATWSVDEEGKQSHQYWPFATVDLYN